MNRVRSVGDSAAVKAADRLPAAAGNRAAFRAHLVEAQLTQANTRLDDMLKKIDEVGTALGRTLTISDLKRYKQAIGSFFKEALRLGTQVKTELEWDSQAWEHRTLVTIEKVNAALEELTTLVHAQEQDRLKILAKMGDIKGMLLDIRM